MSYILDALKKAEADRDPDARASLAMAQHERRRNRWLAYALVIALIANGAILLWLFVPEDQPIPDIVSEAPVTRDPMPRDPIGIDRSAPPQVSATPQIRAPAPPATRPPPSTETEVLRPAAPRTADAAGSTVPGDTVIGPGSRPAPTSEPVPVGSLPADQRGRFPSLEFSTHIYADDADLRAIVVNGTRLEEGDRLENLSLHQITEEGAVFRFEGRLVSVSVLDAWN